MKLVSSPAIRREAEHYTVDSVYFTSIVFSIQYTVFTIQVECLLYNGQCLIYK